MNIVLDGVDKMVEFGKEFGLDADRVKLAVGCGNFSITHIRVKDSKKDYELRTSEGKLVMGKIKIAEIDAIADGTKQELKYYASNSVIISSCNEILEKFGISSDKNGKLKETIHVKEVKEKEGEKGRLPYLYFV